jgi:alpha-beta hydrolase superfamily lysophospholipase
MDAHKVEPRFAMFPRALSEKSQLTSLADVPALIAHPDWKTPAPVMLWMHGRTVSKELDAGRYLRWIRAGMAAVSVDLPGHGERPGPKLHSPDDTPHVLARMVREIDLVIQALRNRDDAYLFDFNRIGIGGMSAGGMATLRRLSYDHTFICAAVESTTGWLAELYEPTLSTGRPWPSTHDASAIENIDPMQHLDGFRPIPLLALHSESDEIVPIGGMRAFLDALRERYESAQTDPEIIELKSWPTTGAPSEHAGFGKMASEAKSLQVEFLVRHLIGS